MADPSKHEAHDLPLITRLIEDEVNRWLDTRLNLAAGVLGPAVVDQVRHLHLAGAHYQLVPRVIDALRRAGLLAQAAP